MAFSLFAPNSSSSFLLCPSKITMVFWHATHGMVFYNLFTSLNPCEKEASLLLRPSFDIILLLGPLSFNDKENGKQGKSKTNLCEEIQIWA